MNYFDNLYTLLEIAINHNFSSANLSHLSRWLNEQNVDKIRENFPELKKFIPYCKWYVLQGRNVLAMSVYIYDMYKNTVLLPDLNIYD